MFYESNESVKENKYVQLLAETIPSHLKTLEGLAAANNGYLALKRVIVFIYVLFNNVFILLLNNLIVFS